MEKTVAVPSLGSSDGSDEVRILRWIKSEGDEGKKGGSCLKVESDKDSVEIEASDDGAENSICAGAGGFVKFGAVVAVIGN